MRPKQAARLRGDRLSAMKDSDTVTELTADRKIWRDRAGRGRDLSRELLWGEQSLGDALNERCAAELAHQWWRQKQQTSSTCVCLHRGRSIRPC